MSTFAVMNLVPPSDWLLLAQSETAIRLIEWSLPETPLGWTLLVGGAALMIAFTVWMYLRDTVEHPPWVTFILTTLRLAVIVGLLLVLLNPQERVQRVVTRPSRMAILVDTSLSMADPQNAPPTTPDESWDPQSRAQAAQAALRDSGVLDELRKLHNISLFTFDGQLVEQAVFPQDSVLTGDSEDSDEGDDESEPEAQPSADESSSPNQLDPKTFKWNEVLQPVGRETRLGEALAELIRTQGGNTLAGVAVFSDGGLNAGVGEDAAIAAASRSEKPIRVATVGLGDVTEPANLMLTQVRAPSDVRYTVGREKQDPFDITAYLQATGMEGKQAVVKLLRHPADTEESTAAEIDSVPLRLPEDGSAVEVRFTEEPDTAGRFRYVVRVEPPAGIRDYRDDDNEKDLAINFVSRNTSVLIIAGGPMRDYRFSRNMLHRTPTFDVDVWLQTVSPSEVSMVSQDSSDLLTEFPRQFPLRPISDRLPETTDSPKTYDVVIAFDPDWTELAPEDLEHLSDWVRRQRGGLILVAGDINTPTVADDDPALEPVRDLYPVVLSRRILLDPASLAAEQPWPIGLTDAGRQSGYLQIAESADETSQFWNAFPGFYRVYPTRKPKDLATVQAVFTDPSAQSDGIPVLFATQQFGGGQVLYIGSPEVWRTRAYEEEYFNRFWVKAVNEVGRGRLQQGDGRAVILMDRTDFVIGETVRVRVQANDESGRPLTTGSLPMTVLNPAGRSVFPEGAELLPDPVNIGQFSGTFRAAVPGGYEISVELPGAETSESLSTNIDVAVPQLERMNPRQNRTLLTQIAEETSGEYLTVEQVQTRLPEIFSTSAAEATRIDEDLRTLWDRMWLLYAVLGCLSAEWLMRKLLKLA
ncbi:hypothetical protein [Stratiformator vulcanicus]|uniref:VWFA domain-containing protein n=1 Tax=Stratiformator vulcanicus TaxID=2527980 RepID=A0A517R2M3_9PLAN|nr:hypothetical protein [Stratiformator vulcanicus]QDT38127.1 hypothetical protein Pan189_25170 [Stratiformator vulcanicus]